MASTAAGGDAGVTRLLLVRHGESQVTVDRIVGGPRSCTGLSPLGREQVAALADRFRRIGFRADRLLASTLPRAIETAEILAPALGDLPVELDADLSEHDPGEGDGLTWEAFAARYELPDWERDPYQPLAPGGESWATFQLRVGAALHRLADELAGTTAVLACHGGVVDASLRTFLGLPLAGTFELETRNASITEWRLVPTVSGPRRWRLVRYDDAAHLEGLAPTS